MIVPPFSWQQRPVCGPHACGQTDTSICGKRAAGLTADANLRPNRKSPQDSGISIEQPTCSHLTCMLHHLVKRPSCKCQSLLPRVHGRPGRHLSCAGHLPSYTPMSSNKAAACCQSFSCSHALPHHWLGHCKHSVVLVLEQYSSINCSSMGKRMECVTVLSSDKLPALVEDSEVFSPAAEIVGWFGHLLSAVAVAGARREKLASQVWLARSMHQLSCSVHIIVRPAINAHGHGLLNKAN